MNPKNELKKLQTELLDLQKKATAEGRDFTDEEMADIEAKAARALELKDTIERQEKGDALIASLTKATATTTPGTGGKAGEWAQKALNVVREAVPGIGTPDGMKSVSVTSVRVPALLSPVTLDGPARTVLDLIPVADAQGVRREGNGYSYVRQIARENNAAAVPDFGEKPESNYGFDEVSGTFSVYANKVTGLPWRWLDDHATIVDVVKGQLAEDVLYALERDALTGDGTNDKFTGILNTSGVQVAPFEGDALSTLTAAKWTLLGDDRNLTGIVMNPVDVRALEALRENGTTGGFLFRNRAELADYLGAPIVTSKGIPAGTAIAADWSQVELIPLHDDELVIDPKNRTENNTFDVMYEGRYALRVKKPGDFVRVELADPEAGA